MARSLFPSAIAGGVVVALIATACDKDDPVKGEEGLKREELGSFVTDTGGSVAVPFEVPAESVSTLVYCGPYGWDALATAEYINDPTGAGIYSFEDETATPMRVGTHADLLPTLLPVSPDLDISAGGYTLGLYVQADAYPVTVACDAVHRVQEVGDAATVDVHVVFVGADQVVPGLTAAEGETTLQPVLDAVAELWSTAGVEIGEVTFEDFSGDVERFASVDGDQEFGELLRTVGTPGERKVTFFFVQAITSEDGATVLGLAGGPPGTAAVGGTSKSGVVVGAADAVEDPDLTARIVAHEGAHFVGLFHTTEKDGSKSDPISDTPECDISADADQSGKLEADECGGKGAENLMWWSASSDSRELSADQGWVFRRSAAVH